MVGREWVWRRGNLSRILCKIDLGGGGHVSSARRPNFRGVVCKNIGLSGKSLGQGGVEGKSSDF